MTTTLFAEYRTALVVWALSMASVVACYAAIATVAHLFGR